MAYRKGWFGDSHGHRLAAKGIRLYARKEQVFVDPVFFAKKREQAVGTYALASDVRDGLTFQEIVAKYPDAEREDLRKRGIRSVEMRTGDGTLTTLDANGVDATAKLAEGSLELRRKMLRVLADPQKSSFLHPQKVELLQERLRRSATSNM